MSHVQAEPAETGQTQSEETQQENEFQHQNLIIEQNKYHYCRGCKDFIDKEVSNKVFKILIG